MFTAKSGRPVSYYGNEYTADIQRKDGKEHPISSVDQLFGILKWLSEHTEPQDI